MNDSPLSPEQQRLLDAPAYRLACEDMDLLKREVMRPVRLQLELHKPELALSEQNIESTIVVFGSARTLPPALAEEQRAAAKREVEANPEDAGARAQLARAEKRWEHSRYYRVAREFSRLVSARCQTHESLNHVVVTGGGPGIMEAGNRGAHDAGAKSIGLNIELPFEQAPNSYITPELCFNFQYFALRKMHFLMRAQALVAFPGGFGTLDELFESLTLIQTRTVDPIPVILVGRAFWDRVVNFPALVEEGVIAGEDLNLFSYAETPEEIWALIHNERADEPKIELT